MIKLFWFLPILGSKAAESLFPGCLFPAWKTRIPLQLLCFAHREDVLQTGTSIHLLLGF